MTSFTLHARQQMLSVAFAGVDPPSFYLALYAGSADPAGPPVELTVLGYARQPLSFAELVLGTVANVADVSFPPMAATSFLGVALLDTLTGGHVWCWADEATPVTVPDEAGVNFAVGEITVVMAA